MNEIKKDVRVLRVLKYSHSMLKLIGMAITFSIVVVGGMRLSQIVTELCTSGVCTLIKTISIMGM